MCGQEADQKGSAGLAASSVHGMHRPTAACAPQRSAVRVRSPSATCPAAGGFPPLEVTPSPRLCGPPTAPPPPPPPQGSAMLSCSDAGPSADGSLLLPLADDGGCSVEGLTVACSTERATAGRKRAPVRLAALLVDQQVRAACTTSDIISYQPESKACRLTAGRETRRMCRAGGACLGACLAERVRAPPSAWRRSPVGPAGEGCAFFVVVQTLGSQRARRRGACGRVWWVVYRKYRPERCSEFR